MVTHVISSATIAEQGNTGAPADITDVAPHPDGRPLRVSRERGRPEPRSVETPAESVLVGEIR